MPPRLPGARPICYVAAIALFSLLSSACRDANVVTNAYDTADEARVAGAFSAGYLPEGLPAGVSDLREAHDPDSSRYWAIFSFPTDQQEAVRALIAPQELPVDGMRMDVPGRIEWWPILLRNEIDSAQLHATGLEVYPTRQGDAILAVNWRQGRAYYWSK